MKYQPPFDPGFAGPVNGIHNADPDAPYVNGDPATGQEGSIPPMESLDHPMRELVHLIQNAGLTPSHSDLQQVRKAVKSMIEAALVSNSTAGGGVALWEGLEAVTGHHKIRSLVAGSNVAIDLVEEPSGSGRYQVRISSTADAGEGAIVLGNIGTGADVYKGLNSGTEEIRRLRGINGITVTQETNSIAIDGSGVGQFMPVFPEIETADNKLTVSAVTGQVTVAADQSFIHRGARRILTSDTLLANRQFSTSANKTYHLRWRWSSGTPGYVLLDTTDVGYNPGSAAESSAIFDSTYDDMLIAKVTTDGSNVPTVTALRNKHALREVVTNTGTITGTTGNSKARTATHTQNWARRPDVLPTWRTITVAPGGTGSGGGSFDADDVHDHDTTLTVSSQDRYGWSANVRRDYAYDMDITVLMIA